MACKESQQGRQKSGGAAHAQGAGANARTSALVHCLLGMNKFVRNSVLSNGQAV